MYSKHLRHSSGILERVQLREQPSTVLLTQPSHKAATSETGNLDELGRDFAFAELRMVRQIAKEVNVGVQSADLHMVILV